MTGDGIKVGATTELQICAGYGKFYAGPMEGGSDEGRQLGQNRDARTIRALGLTECSGEVVEHSRDGLPLAVAGPRLGGVAAPRLVALLLFLLRGMNKLQIGPLLSQFGNDAIDVVFVVIAIIAVIPQKEEVFDAPDLPVMVVVVRNVIVVEGGGGLGHGRGGSLEGGGPRPRRHRRRGRGGHRGGGGQLVSVGRRRRLRGGRETHVPAPQRRRRAQRGARLVGNAGLEVVVAPEAVGAASKAVRRSSLVRHSGARCWYAREEDGRTDERRRRRENGGVG